MAAGPQMNRGGLLKASTIAFEASPFRVPAPELPGAGAASAPEPDRPPEVSIARGDDGTIQSISIRCPCGHEMTLECEYLSEGAQDDDATT